MKTRAGPNELQQLSVLIATCCIDMIGFAMVLPLLPYYALRLKATPELIGLMTAAFSVAQLLAAPYWGRFSDRYGRRPALLIGLFASAIAYVIFGLADALWLLFLSRLVQGAGGGTTGVAQAYVADTVKASGRARALGWLSAATSAGVAIGPAVGSLSHAYFGPTAPGIVAACLCLINVGFAWRWLPESRKPGATRSQRKPVLHAATEVLEHPARPLSRLIWIYSVGMLAFASLTSVLALFLDAEHGVTEKTIGYFYSYVGLLSFVMRSLLLGPIVERLGETRTMRFGTAILVIGLLAYTVAPNLWALAVIIPLVPIGTALLFPSTTALMSRAAPKEDLGTTMGVAQTFAGVARVVAPILATAAFQRVGHSAPFYFAATMVALVGLMSLKVEQLSMHTTETPVPVPAGAAVTADAAVGAEAARKTKREE
jgi:MFS family permease